MQNYKKIKKIISDYVKEMEKINDRRMQYVEHEMKCVAQEVLSFNTLRKNLFKLEDKINGIS